MKIFVTGPGGSHEAARTFLAIGKSFIKAGPRRHGGQFRQLSWPPRLARPGGDKQMGGMYWAFVSVTAAEEEVFSAGMHFLGFRDAEMLDPIDPGPAA